MPETNDFKAFSLNSVYSSHKATEMAVNTLSSLFALKLHQNRKRTDNKFVQFG